ncbi:MAG: hypothetical protein AAFP86_21890, partial [Planctomycetota bacterium]
DYAQRQAEQWDRPLGDLGFFTVGLRVLFDWLGDNPHILRLSAWARLEGTSFTSDASDIENAVRAQVDHMRAVGVIRPEVDTTLALVLVDSAFKGYWDRRQELATRMQGDPELESLDVRYRRTAIEVLLRGLLTPDALSEALSQL